MTLVFDSFRVHTGNKIFVNLINIQLYVVAQTLPMPTSKLLQRG